MENSLPSGTNKSQLAKVFEDFQRLPCPPPPENDDLYDVYSELMEYDGHVAGLVSSFLNGNDINKSLIFRNEELSRNINFFPQDSVEVNLLRTYYKKLEEMIRLLEILASN